MLRVIATSEYKRVNIAIGMRKDIDFENDILLTRKYYISSFTGIGVLSSWILLWDRDLLVMFPWFCDNNIYAWGPSIHLCLPIEFKSRIVAI